MSPSVAHGNTSVIDEAKHLRN